MKPEDVPAELVDRGYAAMLDAGYRVVEDIGDQVPEDQAVRRVLAAVLPEYGARVLEEAAESFTEGGMVRRRLEDLARAARLTGTTEEPTTPVHVGGQVNAEDCPACSPEIDPPPYPWICPGPNSTEEES